VHDQVVNNLLQAEPSEIEELRRRGAESAAAAAAATTAASTIATTASAAAADIGGESDKPNINTAAEQDDQFVGNDEGSVDSAAATGSRTTDASFDT
jgi:hypothetical protein